MKKVEIIEILKRVVEVEADSNYEAIAKVEKMYYNEDIILTEKDKIAPTEFNVID